MAKILKSVPAYAAHLTQEKYAYWSKNWKWFGRKLLDLETAEDAAAFMMIAAVEADAETSKYLTYNDGHSIEPCAALPQYRADVAVPGMEIALTKLFNFESHGANAFNNLAQIAAYPSGAGWTRLSVEKFLDLTMALPIKKLTGFKRDGALADQPPLFQAAEYTVSIAACYLNAHPEDNTIKAKLLTHCRRVFQEATSNKMGARLLAYNATPQFERFASDDEIDHSRKDIQAAIRITPNHRYFKNWQKICPRIFSV